ncbi:helix-turn-helix transcriptional regulator [Sphingomonas sp. Y38-1Y]|uniref:helix-turn-helix domain-containing protein n=1 Tax=Sphingomonas sp. Y38-1Y TaxID=3078265 RepID=UPI0028E990CD|nr:helix-turn-helix transcriptional regulator [Sphingomonas sp. Y38-1Y]
MADLALRSGASPSTITRLEKGEPGIGIGTLADVLIVLGLAERLGELIDIRNDELGLALTDRSLPQRGRSSQAARWRRRGEGGVSSVGDASDDDGVAF